VVSQDEIAAQFVRPVFEGGNGAGKDGIGDGGEDQAEQFGVAAAQPLRHGVGT